MTELWTVCGIGLCALVCLLILRELRKDYAPLFLLGFSVIALAYIIPRLGEAAEFLTECVNLAGGERISVVIRALGVTYLTSTAGEICRSAGESSVGNTIEAAGRVEIILLCIPLFRELLDLAMLG